MSIRQHRTDSIATDDALLAALFADGPRALETTVSRAAPPPPPFPPDARAVIHRPGRSAMTSGRANTCDWVLEFEPRSREFTEPLMGWTGGDDPLRHLRLRFPTREAAMAYARREGLPFTVHEPQEPRPARCGTPAAPAQADTFADPLLALAWEHPHLVMPDLDAALLDPAGAFASPRDVVRHPLLATAERREILRRWLWDARRIEATAEESPLGGGEPSRLDEVLEALALLDRTDGRAAGDAGRRSVTAGMAGPVPAA